MVRQILEQVFGPPISCNPYENQHCGSSIMWMKKWAQVSPLCKRNGQKKGSKRVSVEQQCQDLTQESLTPSLGLCSIWMSAEMAHKESCGRTEGQTGRIFSSKFLFCFVFYLYFMGRCSISLGIYLVRSIGRWHIKQTWKRTEIMRMETRMVATEW